MSIAVVGGGLVGSLEACMLAKRGFKVILFESRHDGRGEPNYYGRSINLAISTRGIEGLKRVGLDGLVDHLGIPMKARMIHDTNGNMKPIPYDPDGRCINSIERAALNTYLLNEAERLGVELRFGQKLVDINFETNQLSFHIRDETTSHSFKDFVTTERFDLVLGCDGAKSSVRNLLSRASQMENSQCYIDHCYIELRIGPKDGNTYKIPHNYLHIWPRGEFMMIALPNKDLSFTCTLFISRDKFCLMSLDEKVDFFKTTFPDAVDLVGQSQLIATLKNTSPSPLVYVKCEPYYVNTIALLGDAAHAMVPFYGQGMNCGFEDCLVLDEMFDLFKVKPNQLTLLRKALDNYNRVRCPNGHAMCDLALYNYLEMRHHVNTLSFFVRKHFDDFMYRLAPNRWLPLYTMVTFTRIPIDECQRRRQRQNKMIRNALLVLGCTLTFFGCGTLLVTSVKKASR